MKNGFKVEMNEVEVEEALASIKRVTSKVLDHYFNEFENELSPHLRKIDRMMFWKLMETVTRSLVDCNFDRIVRLHNTLWEFTVEATGMDPELNKDMITKDKKGLTKIINLFKKNPSWFENEVIEDSVPEDEDFVECLERIRDAR